MNRFLATLLTSVVLTGASGLSSASAADYQIIEAPEAPIVSASVQLYVAARLGITTLRETQFSLDNTLPVPTAIKNNYEDFNYAGFVAIGFDNREGMRAEIEAGYSQFDIDDHTVVALGNERFEGDAAFGKTNVTTVMANAYYDVAFGKLRPYVGAGLGVARVEFDKLGVQVAGSPLTALDTDAYGFAWQIGAGVGYDLTDNIALELGYRLSGIQGLDFGAVDGTVSRDQFLSHTVTTGVRYSF
ncbi:outer membrane beta-barrel protein [Rhizobiaceae bacterium]|nr:outer membrane beta-barrel protein [Rhizobiaceae bacterium]